MGEPSLIQSADWVVRVYRPEAVLAGGPLESGCDGRTLIPFYASDVPGVD